MGLLDNTISSGSLCQSGAAEIKDGYLAKEAMPEDQGAGDRTCQGRRERSHQEELTKEESELLLPLSSGWQYGSLRAGQVLHLDGAGGDSEADVFMMLCRLIGGQVKGTLGWRVRVAVPTTPTLGSSPR